MKFYTSDLHLCHANIIKYEERPFSSIDEMNDQLIRKWNDRVGKGDEVYIVGDFAICKGDTANQLLRRLNGRKYLIRGNHDSFLEDKAFDNALFEWVKDYATVKDDGNVVVLFHYPIALWDRKHHGVIHLYGHVHSNREDHHPLSIRLEKAYNVGVDVRDFEPKSLREIMEEEEILK